MSKALYVLLLVQQLYPNPSTAQNLLRNGGFEKHTSLECPSCQPWALQFAAALPPWKTVNNTAPFICDYLERKDWNIAKATGNYPFDKVKPYAGHTMLQMEYRPSCHSHDFKTRGCSSYLSTTLDTPLSLGKVYELSFRLYILPDKDSSYAQQIGFNLYPDAFLNPQNNLQENTPFLVDTVIFNRWYIVKWLLRPTCNLQFLVLGVFRGPDGPPINGDGNVNRFYIDEVALKNVAEVSADSSRYVTPHCRYTPEEQQSRKPEIAGMDCRFNSSDSRLSNDAMAALDSFALRVKKDPALTFFMVGYTDDQGADNLALSKARVKSVADYLEQQHQLPAFRFFQLYRGEADPVSTNQTETGRQQNRRVEIRQSNVDLADLIYRHLLLATFEGNKNQAFHLVTIWLNMAENARKIYLLFDPRLKLLQSDSRWSDWVVKKVKATYKTFRKPMLAYSLDSLGKEDQKCRTLPYYVENLGAYLALADSTDQRFQVQYFPDTADYQCGQRDEAHFQCFQKLMGANEWPKISEIGQRAAKTAFLVVSHTADTSSVARYLPLLKARCMEGEAEWLYFATLYDRLQVYRGLPQRFGTQYHSSPDPAAKLERFPLEDATKTNQWRIELGLEPFDDL